MSTSNHRQLRTQPEVRQHVRHATTIVALLRNIFELSWKASRCLNLFRSRPLLFELKVCLHENENRAIHVPDGSMHQRPTDAASHSPSRRVESLIRIIRIIRTWRKQPKRPIRIIPRNAMQASPHAVPLLKQVIAGAIAGITVPYSGRGSHSEQRSRFLQTQALARSTIGG